MNLRLYIFFLGAGLMACSSANITVSSDTEFVSNDETKSTNKIDSLIGPFADSVKNEMDEVIAFAEVDFIVNKNPSGNLSNWVADAVFVDQTRTVRMAEPIFCLLNTGGIRSTINQGDVTIGDIYKVMPFDNTVVWVRMPIASLQEIEAYLLQKGGDPISNAVLRGGNLEVNGIIERHTHVWIITSDYLMNGGDNMKFFEKRVEENNTGKLLRDVLLEEAKAQGTLLNDTSNRMIF
jgi:2',3'-cyclic-nucleotide 2'-phosphodiesterase (5'-nucleotidase family)